MAVPEHNELKHPNDIFGWSDADSKWYALGVDASGSISISDSTVLDTPEYFEDTSFTPGDSPADLDINAALARNAKTTQVLNDGPGSFKVAYSLDGASFGDAITLNAKEELRLTGVSVDTIRITHTGTDSAYRVIAI